MSAYYNENDPKAASWLRELIKADLIAPGGVDERSIEDVAPSDLRGYDQHHFFAGIGGWSYALRLAGWPDDRPVWTGSCPCQPFSAAGKRKGTADDRHLWPAWHWLIKQYRPECIFGEQVASKDGIAWLDIVSTDLEGEGYTFAPIVFPACGVGAPHKRERLWFVADAYRGRCEQRNEDFGAVHVADANGATNWSGAKWIECRDGKHRAIEPSVFPLAPRLSGVLEQLRDIESDAKEKVNEYGSASNSNTHEVLLKVQQVFCSIADGEKQPTGMREKLLEAQVLQSFLLCLASTYKGGKNSGSVKETSESIGRRAMRFMLFDCTASSTSCGLRSNEQLTGKPSDALLALSLFLARSASAYKQAAEKANASIYRSIKLRGYGNAIVPQVAKELICAYAEARRILGEEE